MKDLSEKDFIQETKPKKTFSLWLWMTVLVVVLLIAGSLGSWLVSQTKQEIERSPFLQVTNRNFSLFLWQHTEFMRPHMKQKTGYLPGFKTGTSVTPAIAQTEEWVAVPPEVLFEYHTWKRLLGSYVFKRNVAPKEMREFLAYAEEWKPENWKKAPAEYKKLVAELPEISVKDLSNSLPREILQAFIGWKNYFKEGDLINQFAPSSKNVERLLKKYPHYARNYWRNLYPEYLKGYDSEGPERQIPENELPAFLRVALFNDSQT